MRCLLVDEKLHLHKEIAIAGNDVHHLVNVLRKKLGDYLFVNDGKGGYGKAQITSYGRGEIKIKLIDVDYEPYLNKKRVVLCPALLKTDKYCMVLQKAVELAVFAIMPIITTHCVIKNDTNEKWQKTIKTAVEQSGNRYAPQLWPSCDIKTALDNIKVDDAVCFFYEKKLKNGNDWSHVKQAAGDIWIFIGPEGGFTEEELDYTYNNRNVRLFSLGNNIMRAETAAITAMAVINFLNNTYE